jgi:peptidase M23-like protein
VIAVADAGPFVLLAHLRRGSVEVAAGDRVQAGDLVAACGNSGNSTQPHLHIQATDSTEWDRARGLPIAFLADHAPAIPREFEIVTV